ncbi:MAG: DUF5519 family protein [Kofleriaceae bacterium]|nr:DUF5519 family protein [Kofleriaceae bacterium]
MHLDGEAHVPIGRALARELVRAGLARRFPWSDDFVMTPTDDVALATWIFSLRREQIAGAEEQQLHARIVARAAG